MDWENTAQRFGVACFLKGAPPDPTAPGDAAAFFDAVDLAQAWIDRAIAAGRFKYLVLWDGGSGEWVWVNDFDADS